MNSTSVLLYFATWSLVALTPGPAVVCAMTHATRYGFRRALVGIAGIQLGHFVFFGCVASGLAALLETASAAFTTIRTLGALYLFYLGVRIIVASVRPRTSAPKDARPPAQGSLFLQGFVIQVMNPKALIFMSSLLPQFIHPQHSLPVQFIVLLGITIAVDVVVLSGYAYFAQRGVRSLRDSRFMVWLERLFGAALIFFGIRLLTATRK